jgi:hypothetical protein
MPPPARPFRLGALLWGAGMLGVVANAVLLIPPLARGLDLPVPMEAIVLASIAQTGALLAVAVWAGVVLGWRVGLRAPASEALSGGDPAGAVAALGRQLPAGILGGIAVGVLLLGAWAIAPAPLQNDPSGTPFAVRVLYGGITEEVLIRWGLMTLLVWAGWRLIQGREGRPSAALAWAGIGLSAVAFAALHLPYASVLAGSLSADVVAYVLVFNTVAGLVFGYLYWRWGLEAAIVAHALAHVLAYTAAGLVG